VYRSSPPLVRSVLPAYRHVDAGCLCLLPRRSLFVANLRTHTPLFARLPLARATPIAPAAPQPTIAHRALTFTAQLYNTKSIRQQRHCCYSYRHRRLHRPAKALPWSDRPLQTLRAPKYANRAQLERTPTPSENSTVPSNRLDLSPAVKRRRTCRSFVSLASGQQPVCHHYRYYALSNLFPDHLIQDCQCYCSTSRHSLGQLDCRAHHR